MYGKKSDKSSLSTPHKNRNEHTENLENRNVDDNVKKNYLNLINLIKFYQINPIEYVCIGNLEDPMENEIMVDPNLENEIKNEYIFYNNEEMINQEENLITYEEESLFEIRQNNNFKKYNDNSEDDFKNNQEKVDILEFKSSNKLNKLLSEDVVELEFNDMNFWSKNVNKPENLDFLSDL